LILWLPSFSFFFQCEDDMPQQSVDFLSLFG
jgi:hypothetical protein